MTRTQTILALLATAIVAWGCSKSPTGQSAVNTKSLEARVAKLEQDLKTVQARASDYESKWKAEQARGQAVEKERDTLRANLTTRTTERDTLQAQFDGFRKNLKDLIGQAEAAQAAPIPVVPLGAPSSTVANTLPNPKGL